MHLAGLEMVLVQIVQNMVELEMLVMGRLPELVVGDGLDLMFVLAVEQTAVLAGLTGIAGKGKKNKNM